jgi:hypothetical protein
MLTIHILLNKIFYCQFIRNIKIIKIDITYYYKEKRTIG